MRRRQTFCGGREGEDHSSLGKADSLVSFGFVRNAYVERRQSRGINSRRGVVFCFPPFLFLPSIPRQTDSLTLAQVIDFPACRVRTQPTLVSGRPLLRCARACFVLLFLCISTIVVVARDNDVLACVEVFALAPLDEDDDAYCVQMRLGVVEQITASQYFSERF